MGRQLPYPELWLMHQLAQAVARILLDQPYYYKAQNVACYLSMASGELRTKAIVKDLLASGMSDKLYYDETS